MSNDDNKVTSLIIVCCHAIYIGTQSQEDFRSTTSATKDKRAAVYDESNWLLEPFQLGEASTFIEHVREGVQALADNPDAILVFSGGATKASKTTMTEAKGYRDVAEQMRWFGLDKDDHGNERRLGDRVFEESWATDSYQNVLLSLIQFSAYVQEYRSRTAQGQQQQPRQQQQEEKIVRHATLRLKLPRRLLIVTHAFKKNRFIELHLPTIKDLWDSATSTSEAKHNPHKWVEHAEVIGSNPPVDPIRMKHIEEGDRLRGYGAWEVDLKGTGSLLSGKRLGRGWDESVFLAQMAKRFAEEDLQKIRKMISVQDRSVTQPD